MLSYQVSEKEVELWEQAARIETAQGVPTTVSFKKKNGRPFLTGTVTSNSHQSLWQRIKDFREVKSRWGTDLEALVDEVIILTC